MCGRFVQIIEFDELVKQFKLDRYLPLDLPPNPNVAPGDSAYVITNIEHPELQTFQFGLTPHWAKKPMFLINARSEGDYNKEDLKSYAGEMGIASKPSFRNPIKSKRCLVIANGFIEGPQKERLSKPYLIRKASKELFALAGIWDTWVNEQTGEMVNSFSIITTVANAATEEIGHHRSPVIVCTHDQQKWLDHQQPLSEVLKLLKPYKGNDLVNHRISVKIKNPKNKEFELLLPVHDQNPPAMGALF